MNKILKPENFLNLIGILLVIGFVIRLAADYSQYQSTVNSAPFYVFVIVRSLRFLFPGVVCFIVSAYFKKRNQSK
jgi:hypothetical protein